MPKSLVFLSDGWVRKPLSTKGAWLRKTLPFPQFSCLRAHPWSVGTASSRVIRVCCLIVVENCLYPNLRAVKGGGTVWMLTVWARWYGVCHHGGTMLNQLTLTCRAGNRRTIHVVRCSPVFVRIGWGYPCEKKKWAGVLRFDGTGLSKGGILLLGKKWAGWWPILLGCKFLLDLGCHCPIIT